MSKKFGGLGLNGVQLKWIIRTRSNWKKSKSWEPFWSYLQNSTANPAHLQQKWAELSAVSSSQITNNRNFFNFFNSFGNLPSKIKLPCHQKSTTQRKNACYSDLDENIFVPHNDLVRPYVSLYFFCIICVL